MRTAWSRAREIVSDGRLFGALLFSLALIAGPASAQDGIYDVSFEGSSLTTSTGNDTSASAQFSVGNDAGAGANTSFISRFGFNVNADMSAGPGSTDKDGQATHHISFEVHSSRNYSLIIGTAFVGALTRRSDSSGCEGSASLSAVTGHSSFILASGSLDFDGRVLPLSAGDATIDVLETGQAIINVNNPLPVEKHVLEFTWNTAVSSDSCEVAVRFGAPQGTTTGCDACGYPGIPFRTQMDDGHFVSVEYVPSLCGNGVVDSGEECDLGPGNGFGACCDVFCKREPDDMPCSDGLFCNGDGRCLGGECTQPFGDPCAHLGSCAVCDEGTDTCDTSACSPTPTRTPTATATVTPTPTPIGSPRVCDPFFTETFNVNGAGCTFCDSTNTTSCMTECLPPPVCFCGDGPNHDQCCANAPCCEGCPDAGSLRCTASTCSCNFDSCCKTVCPCTGDCDGNGQVSDDELLEGVDSIFDVGARLGCISFDADGDRVVRANELLESVGNILNRCPAARE